MSNQMRPVIIKSFEELNKAELYQIIQLRIAVFIVEQDCPYPDLDDMDQDAQHLWIEDAGEIVCYLRVNPAGSRFLEPSLGRIVTKKSHRNRGLAEKLIKKAIDLVCEKESRAIRISAQCYLEKYYEKFGFIKASEEYLEDNIPHIEMLKDA
jgi:ElaA protein